MRFTGSSHGMRAECSTGELQVVWPPKSGGVYTEY
jgi:hypothetical protein